MARATGMVKLSGKLGDEVYVLNNSYGYHVRKAARPGQKKNESPLQLQYRRTAYLNKLASEINNVLKQTECRVKSSDFYHRVLKRFRQTEQDNRLHLLLGLKGMEVNLRYRLEHIGVPGIIVKPKKGKLEVELRVIDRPYATHREANSYYYEVLMLSWSSSEKAPDHSRQFSAWTRLEEGRPEFVFSFPRAKGMVHWLLAVGIRFGQNEAEIEDLKTQGMQFADAGTLNKKEAEHLENHIAVRKKQQQEDLLKSKQKMKPEPVRVQAKRMH